jgi:N-acetylneuraminic acid mutarotase
MYMGKRNGHTGSVVDEKCFAIGGGIIGDAHVTRVEEYDPQTNEWTEKDEMPTGRARPASSVANGKVYVFGGSAIIDTVEAYTPDATCHDVDGDGFGFPGNAVCPGGSEEDCDESDSAI